METINTPDYNRNDIEVEYYQFLLTPFLKTLKSGFTVASSQMFALTFVMLLDINQYLYESICNKQLHQIKLKNLI